MNVKHFFIMVKVYVTNAGLGYNQYAYLIRLDKSKNGYNYLVIERKNMSGVDRYQLGEVEEDLEDFYVEEVEYNMEDSELHNTFLFEEFLINYSERY